VYAVLFPAGGGFAELALASTDQLAPMPATASFEEAAGLVISAGTAYEALIDRGRLQAGESVLITAAAGGVGSAAVQIAVAQGARAVGVASTANHEYLRDLGAVRDGGRAYFIVLQSSPPQLERGITGESFAAHGGRQRLEELARLVDAGKLRPQRCSPEPQVAANVS
jgi:NADPH:quinone reductase